MVGGEPELLMTVLCDIPYLDILRYPLDAQIAESLRGRVKPVTSTAQISIGMSLGQHPDVLLGVDAHHIGGVRLDTMATQRITLPRDTGRQRVQAQQFPMVRCNQQAVALFRDVADQHVGDILLSTLSFREVAQSVGLHIYVPQSFVVGSHPEVMMTVDIDALDAALDALCLEPVLRMTVEVFCQRI